MTTFLQGSTDGVGRQIACGDGHPTHRVRFDYGLIADDGESFLNDRHRGEDVWALSDAIEALTAVRDRIAAMLRRVITRPDRLVLSRACSVSRRPEPTSD